MSDNSTSSSTSSSNSWTLLSPEEAAMEATGPVDDGTESTGDVPSLSEEVEGISFEVNPREADATLENVLSEEGHQICQETSPELFEEGAVSALSAEADPEICAPVIHATITTSSSDSDLLEAVPFSIATESAHLLSQEPFIETLYEGSFSDLQPSFDFFPEQTAVPVAVSDPVAEIGPTSDPMAEIGPTSELIVKTIPITEIGPTSEPIAEIGPASELIAKTKTIAEIGPTSEPIAEIGPTLELIAKTKPIAEIGSTSEPIAEIGPTLEPIAEIGTTLRPPAEISPFLDLPESSFSYVTADVSLAAHISHAFAVPVLDIPTGVNSQPQSLYPSLSSKINVSFAAESSYPETPASSVLEEKEALTEQEKQKSTRVSRVEESLGLDVPIEHQGRESVLRRRRVHYSEALRQSSDEEDGEETEFQIPERKVEKPGFSMSHVIIGALALLCLSSFFFSDGFDGSELSDQELLQKLAEENKQISILEAQIQMQKEELDRALRAAAERGITDEEHSRMKEELSALPSLKEELDAFKARVSELTQLTGVEPSKLPPGFAKESRRQAAPDRQSGGKDELMRQKKLLEQSKTRLERMEKQNWPRKRLREELVEMQQRLLEQVDHMGRKDEWRRKHKEGENWKNGVGVQKRKEFVKKYRDEWEQRKTARKLEREKRKQERLWQDKPGHKHKHDHTVHQYHESKNFWKLQEKKLRRNQDRPEHCHDVSGCAEAEGLVPVKHSEFQRLLDVYLNKLQRLSVENKEAFHRLLAQFFHGGVFNHSRMLFSEFAEDVADILEDLADVLIDDDDVLEEEMEEFERETLWHFAANSIKSQT